MFDRIAVHYDKVNWFISLGQVRALSRRRSAEGFRPQTTPVHTHTEATETHSTHAQLASSELSRASIWHHVTAEAEGGSMTRTERCECGGGCVCACAYADDVMAAAGAELAAPAAEAAS